MAASSPPALFPALDLAWAQAGPTSAARKPVLSKKGKLGAPALGRETAATPPGPCMGARLRPAQPWRLVGASRPGSAVSRRVGGRGATARRRPPCTL